GRLESRISFSSTITWNGFPLPALIDKDRASLAKAGQKVLEARALHPGRSLAQHYAPLGMDPVLVRAHDGLDTVMDRIMGAPRRCRTELERQELLFARYAERAS
ncbi:GcrY protein, partial [Micrococcus luteus]|nr:GcrY protein [Micrococcus luteus]